MHKLKKYYLDGRLFVVASFLFAITIALFIFSFSPYEYITSLLIDDAMYYPVVANNIASGYGSTFDNITFTNGYHPLWCWLNIPFSLLARNNIDKLFIFKAIVVFTVLTMLFVWSILLKKTELDNKAMAIFILLMGGSYWWSIKVYYSGLEIPLVTLFIGLTLLIFYKMQIDSNIKLSLMLAVSAAVTFLSRLDSIFFVIVLYLFWIYKNRRITKEIVVSGCVLAVIVLPYLIWNKLNFGSFMPISGVKKSYYEISGLTLNLNRIKVFLNNEIMRAAKFINVYSLLLILFLFFLIIYAICKVPKNKAPLQKEYTIFFIIYLSALIHFIFNLFFMSEIDVNWYHYLIYLSIFLSFAVLVERIFILDNRRFLYPILYIFIIVLLGMMLKFGFEKFPRDPKLATIDAADFARSYTPQDTIYGMNDPGIFRFLSERRTIAFNGLIGNREILNLVLAQQPEKIIKKYNVKYYVIIISNDKLEKLRIQPVYLSKQFIQHWPQEGRKATYVAIFKAEEFFKSLLN